MMKTPDFPTYKKETTARLWGCFSCTRPLDGPIIESDYPHGRGHYCIKCSNCHSWTYFDLVGAD